MKSRACADFRQVVSLPAHLQDGSMFRCASIQEFLPHFSSLCLFTGARVGGRKHPQSIGGPGVFACRHFAEAPDPPDEAIARCDEEETSQLIESLKLPTVFSKTAQCFRPNRLKHVHGVKLGAQYLRQQPANHR
jgi:hypothetical protein